MLAAWRGQSLVPQQRIEGLERAFNPALHPELPTIEPFGKLVKVDGEAGTLTFEATP